MENPKLKKLAAAWGATVTTFYPLKDYRGRTIAWVNKKGCEGMSLRQRNKLKGTFIRPAKD